MAVERDFVYCRRLNRGGYREREREREGHKEKKDGQTATERQMIAAEKKKREITIDKKMAIDRDFVFIEV